MDWLGKAIEVLKLPLKYIWAVAITTGLLLFIPQAWLDRIHLTEFSDDHSTYIGAAFLVSTVLVLIHFTGQIWGWTAKKFYFRKMRRMRSDALNRLDPSEKAVLREFFIQAQSTLHLPIDHPTIAGLLAKGLLERVSSVGENSLAGMLFSVTIADDVKSQLTDDMIHLPKSHPTDSDIKFLQENRPDFMPEIERHRQLFHRSGRLGLRRL